MSSNFGYTIFLRSQHEICSDHILFCLFFGCVPASLLIGFPFILSHFYDIISSFCILFSSRCTLDCPLNFVHFIVYSFVLLTNSQYHQPNHRRYQNNQIMIIRLRSPKLPIKNICSNVLNSIAT